MVICDVQRCCSVLAVALSATAAFPVLAISDSVVLNPAPPDTGTVWIHVLASEQTIALVVSEAEVKPGGFIRRLSVQRLGPVEADGAEG